MTTALVLAGHGSHISPQTAAVVWDHVDALRALGIADEITAGFWKETPSFHRVIDTLSADDITIVPMFTARGYFTQTVIPAEFGLEGPVTVRSGRTIRYTRPLNEHPYLAEVVRRRVQTAFDALKTLPSKTAVAILGHSTRRNPESREATEAQANQLRAANIAAEVVAAYLDDTPGIGEVYTLTSAPNLIAVPYFLAAGSHTTIDVPRALSLPPGERQAQINGRTVFYTDPVGTESTLREVIVELARDAGAPLAPARPRSAWDHFPTAGRDQLIDAVLSAGEMPFGELLLTPTKIRPVSGDASHAITDPASLRRLVRGEPFRPLPTAVGLPRGWHVPIAAPEQLHAVIETVYPGVVAEWAAAQMGTLVINSLDAVIRRQTGMFRRLSALSDSQCESVVRRVCGACVREPNWVDGSIDANGLPCAEPCNVWMSHALESSGDE